MKTTKVTAIIASVILVIFMSVGSIANTTSQISGDLTKLTIKKNISTEKNSVSATDAENEFSYLRFDADSFTSNSDIEEVTQSSLNYLRFDVDNFVNSNEEITEMPVENFDYLRFDVNNYSSENQAQLSEMPSDDFSYLRFDVDKFASADLGETADIPQI